MKWVKTSWTYSINYLVFLFVVYRLDVVVVVYAKAVFVFDINVMKQAVTAVGLLLLPYSLPRWFAF